MLFVIENGHSDSPSNGGGLALDPCTSDDACRYLTRATVNFCVTTSLASPVSISTSKRTSPTLPLRATPSMKNDSSR